MSMAAALNSLKAALMNASAKGLSVIQGDADTDLADYPDDGFDYVILPNAQATRRPREALRNVLRIGHSAIVSFPNFGHWRVRTQLAIKGRMPVTGNLANSSHDTQIFISAIRDFVELVDELGAHIAHGAALDQSWVSRSRKCAMVDLEFDGRNKPFSLRAPRAQNCGAILRRFVPA